MLAMFEEAGANARGQQSARAYAHIKVQLLDRRFRSGDLLPISTIATELGVSRQPILQALRRLAAEHMVEIIPQVGCRVIRPQVAQIADFYQLFSAVEGLAAALAAQRRTERQVRQLRLVIHEIELLERASPDLRSSGYRSLNRQFHGLIHQMASAPEVEQLSQSYWDRSELYILNAGESLLFSDRLETANAEHLEMAAAIETRAGDQARQLMAEHVKGFGDDVLARLAARTDVRRAPEAPSVRLR